MCVNLKGVYGKLQCYLPQQTCLGVLEHGGRVGGGPWDLLLPPSRVSMESIKSIWSFRFLLIRIYFPVAFYDNIVNVFFGNSTDFKMLKWL